jgi:uncharacterized damage-inducible protein DinB
MSIGTSLLPEFDHEMATTRRVLERVPSDRGEWRPHAKSFPIGYLAQLLSWMPGWIANAVTETRLDLLTAPKYSFESTETLLAGFDANVRAARAALAAAKDEDFDVDWSLTRGDAVFFTQKRRDIVRNHISHLVHHRGQMTVYLRLLDVPVPMVYGPTADEKMM